MDAGFFEGFQGGRLGMGQPGFGAALRKRPASAASLHQQKLNCAFANSIADRSHLIAFAEPAKVRQPHETGGLVPISSNLSIPYPANSNSARGSRAHPV